MKQKAIFLALALSFFLLSPVRAVEKIDSFAATIKIREDSSMQVQEKIVYNFDTSEKHGIYRTIPVVYPGKLGSLLSVPISNITVTDENGKAYTFSVSRSGKEVKIKIGDADKTVTGVHEYDISYIVKRELLYFNDHDELYWNVTGTDWPVEMSNVIATVYLPKPVAGGAMQTKCFAGFVGSQDNCASIFPLTNAAGEATGAVFKAPYFMTGEGLTIVLGWPPGMVYKPSVFALISYFVQDNYIVLVPIIVFIIMFRLWWTRGRDPKGRGVIVAEYDVPDNLTPLEMGTLTDEQADLSDITAEIIYLASKGYLKIDRTESGMLFKTPEYTLTKLKDYSGVLPDFDTDLLDMLFLSRTSVTLSDLKYKITSEIKSIKDKAYESVSKKGYFEGNPDKVRKKYISFGSVGIFGLYLLAHFGIMSLITFISLGASLFIFLIFGARMPRRSAKGVATKEYILGLKEYLSVVEKDRLKFFNAPEKNPATFEKFLPFAMVLGVEAAWAKQFEGIYNQNPSWYNDPTHQGLFNASSFSSGMRSFSGSVQSVATAKASSGGSGFSGGGGGGGFGGGGGGSW